MHIYLKSCILKPIKNNKVLFLFLLISGSIVVLAASVLLGSTKIPASEILRTLFTSHNNTQIENVLFLVRLPRVMACILCGGCLSLAGLLLQSVLHTPLASPGTIGANSGAGLIVIVFSLLFPSVFSARLVGAFLGAFTAALVIYAVALKTGASKMTIILTGIAISSLLSAGIDTLITIFPDSLNDRATFSVGGFSYITFEQLVYVFPFMLIAILLAWVLSSWLNVLMLGDDIAASLGVNVSLCRFLVIFCAALLSAASVSIAGLIGFVGLIAPHMVRLLVGTNFRYLIPTSIWLGSILVLICDLLARTLFTPFEIPTGIILSYLGAPFFLYLLFRKRRERIL